MYRPTLPLYYQQRPKSSAQLLSLIPLIIWTCAAVWILYGSYGDRRMVLGPCSSRLMQASSVFVKQIDIRDDDIKGAVIYRFLEKPELSCEANWTVSNHLTIAAHSTKEIILWLNKGSRIRIRWESNTASFNKIRLFMLKGERMQETLAPNVTSSPGFPNGSTYGNQVDYTIKDDENYYLSFRNTNPKTMMVSINLEVSAKLYDITKAKSICSTSKERCRFKLLFPHTHYLVIVTPKSVKNSGWYVELSFLARIVIYVAILGALVLVTVLIMYCLQPRDNSIDVNVITVREGHEVTEIDPLLTHKPDSFTYGTNGDDDESGSSSSSEDLYDERLCIICYDNQRNSFFVPCGHCATCEDCAKRIVNEENKCPVCRRLVRKVRRLFKS